MMHAMAAGREGRLSALGDGGAVAESREPTAESRTSATILAGTVSGRVRDGTVCSVRRVRGPRGRRTPRVDPLSTADPLSTPP